MSSVPAPYRDVIEALRRPLQDLPGYVIAIDGENGAGKTTLGRFLAWHFNIALLETDLFRYDGEQPFAYYDDHIRRIIASRLDIPRPVIVEGMRVLDLLMRNKIKHDFLIFVESDASVARTEEMEALLDEYEGRARPREMANVVVQLQT